MSHARNEGPGGCVPWETFQMVTKIAHDAETDLAEIFEAAKVGDAQYVLSAVRWIEERGEIRRDREAA